MNEGVRQSDQAAEHEADLERPAVAVRTPTPEETEEHETLHIFKDWCRACVMGRGKNGPCKTIAERSCVPVAQLDYCFGKTQKGEKTVPILCAVDDLYKRTFACWCLCKGSGDEHAVRGLELYLRGARHEQACCAVRLGERRLASDAGRGREGTRQHLPRDTRRKQRQQRQSRKTPRLRGRLDVHVADPPRGKYKVGIQLEHAINP